MKEINYQVTTWATLASPGFTPKGGSWRRGKTREEEKGKVGYLVTVLVEEGGEEGDVAANEGQNEEALHKDGKAVLLVKVQYAAHVCSGLSGGVTLACGRMSE
jgi:hypothetical protein